MPRQSKSRAVISPNLGVYLDQPKIALDPRALSDGLNFRVQNGKLSNLNLGWTRFDAFTLDGPVLLIDNFFPRGLDEELIFITPTSIYEYNSATSNVLFLNRRYSTGNVAVAVGGTALTFAGGANLATLPVVAGDFININGAADERDPNAVWVEIASVNAGAGTAVLVSAYPGCAAGCGADNFTVRHSLNGDLTNVWVTDVFVDEPTTGNDHWFATNGVDPIITWDGIATQVTERFPTIRAKSLSVYSNMLVLSNLTVSGTSLPTDAINSDVGDPFDLSLGLASQFKVHGGSSEVLRLFPMGDYLVAYSKDSITLLQFVGDPLVFIIRQAVTGTGIVGSRAVADFGDFHQFIGRDSEYKFDGVTLTHIGTQAFREVLRQQDPIRIERTYAHFDEENGDLLWSVPLTSDVGAGTASAPPAKAVVEHYLELDARARLPNPISFRTLPFTAMGYFQRDVGLTWNQISQTWQSLNFRWNDRFFFQAFPFNMAGDSLGRIFTVNTAQDADGAALPSFVRFGKRALGDGRMRGLLSRLYPFVTAFNTPLDVTLHLSEHAQGPATIIAAFSFDQNLPEGGHFVSTFRRARFCEVEFGSDGPGQPWEIAGYDIDVKPGGMR